MLQDIDDFFSRRMYRRISDCWNRPIAGPPLAGTVAVMLRSSCDGNATFEPTGDIVKCVNLGSYNYLGFVDDWAVSCGQKVHNIASITPISACAPAAGGGYTALHSALEDAVARFVGKEAAIVFGTGFATNASGIPALGGKGSLLVSDSLNHSSIVTGARSSGATVSVYKHDDLRGLAKLLRESVIAGQPTTGRSWKKIVVLVEGLYSMEGETVDLAAIVAIAKKYRAYVYLDEAHSIGALGATGRGMCEHAGVAPCDVDILMGTFTKSFSAMGGYIAASRAFIDHVRSSSAGFLLDTAMAPAVTQQVLTAFSVLRGDDGTGIGAEKLARLHDNGNYFRAKLVAMGCAVLGARDSPVIPIMLYNPTKVAAFSRECLARGVAVVVVGYPATPVILARARFCVSAGHTRADLDYALSQIEEVCILLRLRYGRSCFG